MWIEDDERSSATGPSPRRGPGDGDRGDRFHYRRGNEHRAETPSGPLGGGPELVEGRRKGGSAHALLSPRARRVMDAGLDAHDSSTTLIGGRRVACPGGPRQSNRPFDCEGPQRP